MKFYTRLFVLLVMAAAALGGSTLLSADAHAIGMLIPADRSLPPLAVKSHRVGMNITDQAGVTRIEQVFVNHTPRQLEATFIFPVPPGATVSDFSLWINGKKTRGAVLERDKARRIYEGIVRRTEDPGLVEYMDGTLFQARIFPVPANGTQKVEIAFAQVLETTGSVRRMLYPLKTGRSAARLMEDFTIVANISSRAPIKTVYSPSHKIAVSRKSDHRVQVSLEEMGADLERDFMLYLSTDSDDIGLTLLSYDEDGAGGGDGHFMMVLTPSIEVDESALPPKTVTLVVDTSGSMAGEKMEQARQALKHVANKLRPKDSFNVVRFSTDVEKLFAAPTLATRENVARALRFADEMEAAGGTAIDEALTEALKVSRDPSKAHMVIFMTDGRPTVGSTDINEIIRNVKAANTQRARLFTFGVGFEVNTTLLDSIAGDNGGHADYVRPQEDIEVKVSALYSKIAYPVMTDLAVDYGGARVYDVYPRQLPDLFRGGQVVVMGRNRSSMPSRIKVSGRVGDRAVQMAFGEEASGQDADRASKAHDFIPKIWATRKVGYLLDEIRAKGQVSELRDEVVRLARKYGLVTPYTSYLAVDDSEFDNRPRPPVISRGDGLGGGFGANDEDFDAPMARAPRAQKRLKSERVLRGSRGFSDKSGEAAVESSIATEKLKRADSSSDSGGLKTRFVSGRLFVYKQGAWRQDGLGASTLKIKYFSEAYFTILAARPALRKYLSLGRRVVIKVGRQVVEFGPEGKDKVKKAQVLAW